ncbi:MAG: flagellar hook protein [Herminiimonas sp.]|nr:flagellar hook protein [Herminiimonas sp.]
MTTATSGVGTVSSPGIGSNLDVKTIVAQLMATEQGPTTAINNQTASYNAKLSAISSLKSALSTLQQAAQTVNLSTTFKTVTASVADTSALSASVNSANTAGSYNVEVQSLAQAQKLISSGYASKTTAIGNGTLTLDVGTYSAAGSPPVTFTANTGVAQKTITIDSTNNTLEGIRDAINNANTSVSAAIINDGTNYRLSLTSKNSGVANAIKLGVTENGGAGLAQLAYDGSTGGVSKLTQNTAPKNAVIKVDGISITSSSNTITDAIQGVTLNLTKEMAAGTTTQLTLANDTTNASAAIQSFVNAYNAVSTQIANSTAYDAATGTASVLTGDATMRTIQAQLRNALLSAIPGASSGLSVLSDAGISFQTDGTLAIDSTKLATALADPQKDLSRLFVTSTDGTIGFGSRVNSVVSSMIFGTDATLNGRIDGINTSIKDLAKQLTDENTRLAAVQQRYNTQFTALDVMVSSMTQTSNFLTQQFAALTATPK